MESGSRGVLVSNGILSSFHHHARLFRSTLIALSLVTALGSSAALAAESSTYSVQPGDTLNGIASRLGVRTTDLLTTNDIDDPDLVRVGQVLRVPAGDASASETRPVLSSRSTRQAATAFAWPVRGPITTYFGERGPLWSRGWHPGLDIGLPIGVPIGAAGEGVVVEAESSGWNSGYGSYVKVDHGGGLVTLYAHMSRVAAEVGDRVVPGTVLGYIGSTGASTGPHLHLEFRQDGQVRDPLLYLP